MHDERASGRPVAGDAAAPRLLVGLHRLPRLGDLCDRGVLGQVLRPDRGPQFIVELLEHAIGGEPFRSVEPYLAHSFRERALPTGGRRIIRVAGVAVLEHAAI